MQRIIRFFNTENKIPNITLPPPHIKYYQASGSQFRLFFDITLPHTMLLMISTEVLQLHKGNGQTQSSAVGILVGLMAIYAGDEFLLQAWGIVSKVIWGFRLP